MGFALRLRLITTVLMCALAAGTIVAQEALAVRSSVVLSPKISKRLGEVNFRVSCGADGSISIPLSHELSLTPSPIARLSADGTLLAQINFEQVPGFEKGIVEDFAPGPDGETYVLGNAFVRGTPDTGVLYDQFSTLLRFDAIGHLIARHAVTRKIAHPRLAVFASGDALIVGLAFDGPYRGLSLAALVSSEGVLLRETRLPEILTRQEPGYNSAHQPKMKSPMLIPMIGDDDRVVIFREGGTGAVAFISNAFEISSVTALKHPSGTRVRAPAVLGTGWLFAMLEDLQQPDPRARTKYARFTLRDGEIAATYRDLPFLVGPACKSSDEVLFFDITKGTLNVVVPAASESLFERLF